MLRKLLTYPGGAPVRLAHLFLFPALGFLITLGAIFPAGATPPEPQVFGAWSVECKPHSGGPEKICVASQLVSADKEGKQVVLGVMVTPTSGQALPHILFRFRPDANREAGAGVKIDDQEAFRVPISQCDTLICEVRSIMPETLLKQMQGGKLMQFAIFIGNQQQTFPVSLNGFGKAYMALGAAPGNP